ncbi:MAG TPA: metallophosphoesterase [Steroidobacteraceae bacterium]|nr:metallophosphoesterase [Steroidobacteraceae bacterium]
MLAALCLSAPVGLRAGPGDEPPRFEIAPPAAPGPLTFVVYGDTRFTAREQVANARARRALVGKIADEHPAAILIGGDLIYEGTDMDDYSVYRSETLEWTRRRIPVFPALGNHEFNGCNPAGAASPCLENWWRAFAELELRPFRWYSVAIGPEILALVLDSDSPLKPGSEQRRWLEREITSADPRVRFILIVLHYPPVRDPVLPRGKDEAQVQQYLSAEAPTLHAQVIVVGSHVHNYERFSRDGVTYLVSGGGGAKPLPVFRLAGELSKLETSVNFHFLRFTLEHERLTGTMVRFDAADRTGNPWSEPDRFEIAPR